MVNEVTVVARQRQLKYQYGVCIWEGSFSWFIWEGFYWLGSFARLREVEPLGDHWILGRFQAGVFSCLGVHAHHAPAEWLGEQVMEQRILNVPDAVVADRGHQEDDYGFSSVVNGWQRCDGGFRMPDRDILYVQHLLERWSRATMIQEWRYADA